MRGAGGAHIVESSEASRACACERPSHSVPGAMALVALAEGGAASVARKAHCHSSLEGSCGTCLFA